MNKKIKFTWDIHWDCNYRCPYCWWHNKWDSLKPRNYYPGTKKLVEVWKRIYNLYGSVQIDLVGGEPLSYPDIFGFLAQILQYHSVRITTNLSQDIEPIAAIPASLLSNLTIQPSFHPIFADLRSFKEKIRKLNEYHIPIPSLNYLAYPPQMPEIPHLREEFGKENIYVAVLRFLGNYNSKQYPESYTEQELSLIGWEDPEMKKNNLTINQMHIFKDKLCNAGHTYGVIHPDGRVQRCGGSGQSKDIVVGNIFDDDFVMLSGPQPCRSEMCPCYEWKFLLAK